MKTGFHYTQFMFPAGRLITAKAFKAAAGHIHAAAGGESY